MRAVVWDGFGVPPVVKAIPDPVAGPGQVLVRQAFSSVTAGDALMAAGRPYAFRPVFRAMLRPPVLGREVAGTVVSVGDGVTAASVGDRVVGEAGQAWAELVSVPAGDLAVVPDDVPLSLAATLPVSAITALQGLRAGGLREGARVLVVGASGGVGHFAVQLAAAAGATVTGVCSGTKADEVRALGAERVIDYRRERFTDVGERYDLLFDLAGTEPVGACLGVLADDGRFVSSSGTNGGPWLGPLPRLLTVALRSLVDRRLTVLGTSPDPDDLRTLVGHVQRGELRPWVGQQRDLDEAPEAVAAQVAGEVRGKTVLAIGGEDGDKASAARVMVPPSRVASPAASG